MYWYKTDFAETYDDMHICLLSQGKKSMHFTVVPRGPSVTLPRAIRKNWWIGTPEPLTRLRIAFNIYPITCGQDIIIMDFRTPVADINLIYTWHYGGFVI